MLLNQLVAFRPFETDEDTAASRPYSRDRIVRWELNLASDGRFLGLSDLADPSDRATRNGRPRAVPHAARTVGIAPAMGADDIQYVLGWVDTKSKPERVAAAHAAFVALCRRWAAEHPAEPVAQTIVSFYDVGGLTEDPHGRKWTSKDTVEIVVDGYPVTHCDSLWQVWQRVVEERKSGGGTTGPGRRGLCLVCGQIGALLNRLPQALPKALVPRADKEVALLSANKPIHTYDFSEGLGTAPICIGCGTAAVTNLATVLGGKEHTFTYPRQRSRMAWWVTHNGDPATIELLDQKPSVIADHFRSVVEGRKRRTLGEHELCSVTVSGNRARLVVHDWIEMPLTAAETAVERWFRDHETVQFWKDEHSWYPLWLLLTCAGQWLPGRGEATGRYIPLYDKAADRPDDLAHLLAKSALQGDRLPPHVLAHVVRRVRTDGQVDGPRVALLRVALTRHPNPTVEAPVPGLDPEKKEPAYVSGRLFATLEATQRAAYPRDDAPNTTFFDRYFAGAIANPAVATVQGCQMWPAWIRKIRTSAEREFTTEGRNRRRAVAAALENRLAQIFEQLDAAPLPGRVTTEHQSLFIVGYYHQRAHDLARARAGRAPEITTDPDHETLPDTQDA